MIPSSNQLKDEALLKLQGNWANPIVAILVVGVIMGASSIIPLSGLLIGGPFALGMAAFFQKISRNIPVEIGNIFDGFKKFGNAIGAYILILVIVILGIVLLIVPGIIAALALSQTYYIMNDNPEMSITDAMQKSHEMMKGHRGEFFLLNLSFIGWALLCILTLGLGFFVLAPYVSTTNAIYYNYLSEYKNKEIEELGSNLES
jgi:uncharacterized membrane protein